MNNEIYRVTLMVADLGWVDFDLDVQSYWPSVKLPSAQEGIRQIVEWWKLEINQKKNRNASAALVSAERPASLSANGPFS